MKIIPSLLLFVAFSCLTGCGGMQSGSSSTSAMPAASPAALPATASHAAAADDVMRVGDKITIRLTGVPGDEGSIVEVQIPESGDITVALLKQSFHAVGRTPADLAADIVAGYKSEQIYSNPNVTVIPEERFVNVGGDVRSPQRVAYTSDLTLLGAINSCGGFTEYANRKSVRILRGQQVLQVDAVSAAKNPGADPAVYAGDQIYVPRTIF